MSVNLNDQGMTAIIDVVTTCCDVEFYWTLIVRGQLLLLGIRDCIAIFFILL